MNESTLTELRVGIDIFLKMGAKIQELELRNQALLDEIAVSNMAVDEMLKEMEQIKLSY